MSKIDKKKLSERDICTKFITPALVRSGWDSQTTVREEVSFTDGRMAARGEGHSRGPQKRADYILNHQDIRRQRLAAQPPHEPRAAARRHDPRGRLARGVDESRSQRRSASGPVSSLAERPQRACALMASLLAVFVGCAPDVVHSDDSEATGGAGSPTSKGGSATSEVSETSSEEGSTSEGPTSGVSEASEGSTGGGVTTGTTGGEPSGDACDVVVIEDPNLEADIRHMLGLDDDEPLLGKDAAKAYTLFVFGAEPVVSLAGIECLTGLETLHISPENLIKDLEPLSGLSELRVLSILGNGLSDLSPLSGLSELRELNVQSNAIDDITPLASLAKLESLLLGQNPVSDLSPLAGHPSLYSLQVGETSVTTLEHIGTITGLEVLVAGGNGLVSLEPLATLPNLRKLSVAHNEVTDLTPLSGLTKLESLIAHDNHLADLSPLASLTQLEVIFLNDNEISDIAPLTSLTQIERISLNDNAIGDIAPLAELPMLSSLGISDNQITTLAPLIEGPIVGMCHELFAEGNPLDQNTIESVIPTLCSKGMNVHWPGGSCIACY